MKVVWEPIEGATQSARLLRLRQPAFSGAFHAHEAIELTWIERGSGTRIVGHQVQPFEAGDLVLIGPGLPHLWHTHGDCAEGAWATVLQVLPTAHLNELPEWRGLAELWQRARHGLSVEEPLRARIAARLQAMPHTPGPRLLGEALCLLGELAECQTHLRALDLSPVPQSISDAGRQRRLDALLRWTHEHLHEPIDSAQAAAVLHVSPGAFSRSFHRMAGKPFTDYVNDLRIAEACVLLRRHDRPVAEVARRCGFLTLSHFNRQFRLRVGKTPRAYRRGSA